MEGNIANIINELVKNGQTILLALAAGGFVIGAYHQMTGGKDGAQLAKSWYKGTIFGLFVGMSAMQIVSFFQSKITF